MWQTDAKNDNLIESIKQSAKQIGNLYKTSDSPISVK